MGNRAAGRLKSTRHLTTKKFTARKLSAILIKRQWPRTFEEELVSERIVWMGSEKKKGRGGGTRSVDKREDFSGWLGVLTQAKGRREFPRKKDERERETGTISIGCDLPVLDPMGTGRRA